jgi:xanthine dehydrogenase accessory factor
MSQNSFDIIARVNELLENGETFCLATVVVSKNPHLAVGEKALVRGDGSMEGNLGTGPSDSIVRDLALASLKEKKSRTIDVEEDVRVFFDVLSAENRLLVCGAGHIAVPLARFAREVGLKVTVIDDRADFADPARFPHCDVIAEEFSTVLRDFPMSLSTYVVVITRGHEHDVDCLLEILNKDAAYIGLIGSRRRVRFVLEILEKKGIPRKRLQEIFTPIGTPIGAESPAEIALSIAAELVCVCRKGPHQARLLRTAIGLKQ